jgi:hypothetical protein
VSCFTGRNALCRRSLSTNTSGNSSCYNLRISFASNEVRTKHSHKGLRDQIFADHTRTLTECFEPKLSGEEKPLFRESGGYLWRPRPDRSLMTSQTQGREFDVQIEETPKTAIKPKTRTVPRNFQLFLRIFGGHGPYPRKPLSRVIPSASWQMPSQPT